MSTAQQYKRDSNGIRLDIQGGMNTVLSPDLLPPGTFAYLQNVRRYLQGRTVARAPLGANLIPSTVGAGITSLIRLNDTTPTGPVSGFALIEGANTTLYINSTAIANGLTGLPLTFVTFRPNASPPPWCYTADNSAGGVTLTTTNLLTGASATYVGNGMMKVRSDGVIWHMGIAEPQTAPTIVFVGGGSGVTQIFYRFIYRSSATGAVSNPSPESIAGTNAQFAPAETVNASDFATKITFNAIQYEYNAPQLRTTGTVGPGVTTDYVIPHEFGFTIPDGTNVGSVTGTGGTGMTPGTYALVFTGGGGTGAAGTITVTSPTAFTTTITNGGTGYTAPPSVTAATGGTPPTLDAVLSTPVNIDGIQIDLNWLGQSAGTGVLSTASLFYLGQPLGQAKFPGVANQSFATDTLQGGNSDTWGATLTPAIINDPSFGFGVQITTQSVGGSDRSFLDSFTMTVYYSTQNADITPRPSADPQVDKIDIYRMGGALPDFTYVGTTPNTNAVFNDTLNDLAAVDNPLLEFDNYEPFPSIDMPQAGTVNVTAGAVAGTMDVTWVSGDIFNIRWLPGTIIIIGTIAYTFYNRPSDTTHLTVVFENLPFPVPTTGLVYEIQQPILAAQPSPAIWGPTPDNGGSFYFGLDPLNTGQLVWSKGNNFDSAPDTNRLDVTSGSEVLMNGVITSELSAVFSTERFWLIYPNFADAVATVTGVTGTQWTLIQSAATRGLYMRFAIDALGALIAWRAKDCLCISMGGGPDQSITDAIYNLFPHEGFVPTPVILGGQTVFPPDDTKSNAQTIKVAPGYIFYNYQDTTGTQRTLCYDIAGKGWSVDAYTPRVNCHLWAVGQVDQLLVGCADGTVRQLQAGNTESAVAVIVTRSENAGDDRAFKRVGDVFVKALINSVVSVGLWASRLTTPLTGYAPTTLNGTGILAPYVIDFTAGFADDVDDIGAVFRWEVGANNVLDLWQPDWIFLPETTQDRPTDWDNGGSNDNKLYQGLILEANTFNVAKTFSVEDDKGNLHVPTVMPTTFNGQSVKAYSFTTPFQSHQVRIVTTDGVPWQLWPSGTGSAKWVMVPFPEAAETWSTELTSLDGVGWQHLRYLDIEYTSIAPVTITFTVDVNNESRAPATVTLPASGGAQTKFFSQVTPNKWKLLSMTASSSSPFNLMAEGCEVWIKSWGSDQAYRRANPFGGATDPSAQI